MLDKLWTSVQRFFTENSDSYDLDEQEDHALQENLKIVITKFFIHNTEFSKVENIKSILNFLEGSFLPRPEVIHTTGVPDEGSESYLSDKALSSLINKKHCISFYNYFTNSFFSIQYIRNHIVLSLAITKRDVVNDNFEGLKKFIKELIVLTNPYYVVSSYESALDTFKHTHYSNVLRTWFCRTGLFWLQYYDKEETRRQGGDELLLNPHIKYEKLNDGLIIQVGETPFECETKEGITLMVKATRAMPPALYEISDDI